MSTTEQFDSLLKELATLKAPGVSGSRIKKLTDIALRNVSDESQLITSLYSNCKATPSLHKLGTLYVVDSIVRQYVDEAKKQNQEVSASAPEGTYAAGVFRISELVESLIDDALEFLISAAQILKISKLVDIWERAETFSPETILRMRTKHFKSLTPPGSPKREILAPKADNADSGSILLALASLAKQNGSSSSTPTAVPAQTVDSGASKPPVQADSNNANNILSQLSALAGKPAGTPAPAPQQPPVPAPAQPDQYIFNMLQQMQNGNGAPTGPPNGGPGNGNYGNLANNSVPTGPSGPRGPDYSTGRRGRDDNGYDGYSRRNRSRSPNHGGLGNRRQRSPPRGFQGAGLFQPPQQFGQQQFGQPQQFGQQQPQQQFGQQQFALGPRGQQQQQFNQPPAGPGPQAELNMEGTAHYRPRNVGFDQTLPQGSFKVLSRTLFIGGVPRGMGEKELSSVLQPFAEVQSVILNSERKHAFVKVYSRREAEQVIQSFNKDNSLPLRTRWGVGFGPRDCCNYQHGISIIPIQRLTDADRSWVVQAQWGGTGGQPLLSGMVIDEPDIEIGAGISSKAMSKKMPTNSARNGPKSNRPGEPDEDYVKTTLLALNSGGMSHGALPDFNTYNQSAVNPLSGLFGNANNGPQPLFQPLGGFPNQNQNFGAPQGANNANLSAQLQNFFQNGGAQ